jgi:hypothetical protein
MTHFSGNIPSLRNMCENSSIQKERNDELWINNKNDRKWRLKKLRIPEETKPMKWRQ